MGEVNSEVVRYENRDALAVITLNRPHRLNAVNAELVDGLLDALTRAAEDGAGACILRGEGTSFCAGHDLKDDEEDVSSELEHERLQHVQDITRKVRGASFPVIAAVHGYALGAGCEFALCSDLIIAARSAMFGFPEVGVGLGITGGISHILPLAVGLAKAKELVLLGEFFDADTAARLGLVNWVVADELLDARATELAVQLRDRPRSALSHAKMALDRGPASDIEAAFENEISVAMALHGSDDAMRASESFRRRSADRAGNA